MLETYNYEIILLDTTSRILENDLYWAMKSRKAVANRGVTLNKLLVVYFYIVYLCIRMSNLRVRLAFIYYTDIFISSIYFPICSVYIF